MKVALLLVTASTLGAGGCANNDISLSILQMQAVSPATMCVAMAMASAGTVGRDRGTLDVSAVTTTGYIAVPIIRNNLGPNGTSVEFNSIQLTGADVKLKNPEGAPLALSSGPSSFFYAAAAGRLDPAGLAAMFVEALPAPAAKELAPMIPAGGILTIISEIRPVGQHQGDQVVGGAIEFPIDLCSGCLVQDRGACPLPKGTVAVTPCFPQQDDPTVCCDDATSGQTLCGGVAPVAM
jgi:hypothetical protein